MVTTTMMMGEQRARDLFHGCRRTQLFDYACYSRNRVVWSFVSLSTLFITCCLRVRIFVFIILVLSFLFRLYPHHFSFTLFIGDFDASCVQINVLSFVTICALLWSLWQHL